VLILASGNFQQDDLPGSYELPSGLNRKAEEKSALTTTLDYYLLRSDTVRKCTVIKIESAEQGARYDRATRYEAHVHAARLRHTSALSARVFIRDDPRDQSHSMGKARRDHCVCGRPGLESGAASLVGIRTKASFQVQGSQRCEYATVLRVLQLFGCHRSKATGAT
jgi:hypothetical protein